VGLGSTAPVPGARKPVSKPYTSRNNIAVVPHLLVIAKLSKTRSLLYSSDAHKTTERKPASRHAGTLAGLPYVEHRQRPVAYAVSGYRPLTWLLPP
jgi:hypothetical protein